MNPPAAPPGPETSQHPERITVDQLRYCPDHVGRYRFALQWVPGAEVLDVCCGTGYGSVMMAVSGARSVHGVDIAPEAIEAARSGWAPPGLTFEVMNALEMPFAGRFDLAICFEGIEHVPDPQRLFANITRSLRPGGIAIVSTPNAAAQPGGHSGNPYHLRELYLEEFEGMARRCFADVKLYFQRRSDPLDAPWSFMRAVKHLCPPALRRSFRRLGGGGGSPASAPVSGEAWLAPDLDDRWYPRSWSYMSYPGVEPEYVPTVLMAVCRGPRQD